MLMSAVILSMVRNKFISGLESFYDFDWERDVTDLSGREELSIGPYRIEFVYKDNNLTMNVYFNTESNVPTQYLPRLVQVRTIDVSSGDEGAAKVDHFTHKCVQRFVGLHEKCMSPDLKIKYKGSARIR